MHLGLTDYRACWDLQHRLADLRRAVGIPDILLLTEHRHVYTMGRSGNPHHLLAGERELRERGIAFCETDRGGDITYHGQGQIVGYPILDLRGYYLDLHRYLRDLEEVVIRTLSGYGVHAGRLEGHTGVWVGGEKICAIGIKTSRWVTMHGFALNVSPDLSYFDRIIPCGIFDRGVTSLKELRGSAPGCHEVALRVRDQFAEIFSCETKELSIVELASFLSGTQQELTPDRAVAVAPEHGLP